MEHENSGKVHWIVGIVWILCGALPFVVLLLLIN